MSTEIIDPPPPSSRSTPLVAVAVIGLVLLFLPALAFVVGARAEPIENRPLADFPSPADGWSFFPGMNAWSTDHLPLRKDAVALNDQLVELAFGEPPLAGGGAAPPPGTGSEESSASLAALFPRVIEGSNDWLYFGADISNQCLAERDVAEVVATVVRLRNSVEASGRRFVLVVAPDKTTIVPEYLPNDYAGEDCSTERREEFWERLSQAEGSAEWVVDLRGPLRDRQEQIGEPIYRPGDSHWKPLGGVVFGEEVAERLQPGLYAGTTAVLAEPLTIRGDLYRMLGREGADTFDDYRLDRPGVNLEYDSFPPPPARPVHLVATSTGVPLFQPSTLLLADSYTATAKAVVYPLFGDLTVLHSQAALDFPAVAGEAARAADVIVLELVERDLISGMAGVVQPEAVAGIELGLR